MKKPVLFFMIVSNNLTYAQNFDVQVGFSKHNSVLIS